MLERILNRKWLAWLAALGIIMGLSTLLMRRWLFGAGLPISHRKEVLSELTIVWMFKQELLEGQLLSEWNPYWFSGFPWLRLLSYPLYYVLAALSVWGRMSLQTVQRLFFYLVLAGSGLAMFGYLKYLLDDWRGALVAAVAYVAFPYHNHVGVETWAHALIWLLLPLIFWTTELSTTKGARRTHYLLLTGIIAASLPVVSGEYAVIAGSFVALYFLACQGREIYRGNQTWSAMLKGVGLVGAVAVGLSSFYILPNLFEFQHLGIRMRRATQDIVSGAAPADYALTPGLVLYAITRRLHLPLHPARLSPLAHAFGSVSWYPGLVVTALTILGIVAGRRQFTAICALIGLALALLFSTGFMLAVGMSRLLIVRRLPPFRYLLPGTFFCCILVGYGTQWLLQYRHVRGPWRSLSMGLALIFLIVIDFWPSAAAYRITDAYFSADEKEAYVWLGEQGERGRMWESGGSVQDNHVRTFSLFEIPRPRYGGYRDGGAPLYTWQQAHWTKVRTALQLHHVRYVMLREDDEGVEDIQEQLEDYELVFTSGNVQIWENPQIGTYAQFYDGVAFDATLDFRHPLRALPAFVWRDIAMVSMDCYHCEPLPIDDDTEPIAELARYDYFLVDDDTTASERVAPLQDLEGVVVTPAGLDTLEEARGRRVSVWSEREGYHDIQLQVQTSRAGVLTIAESWYPHWRVWVNDVPRQVLRTNWALLGVWLEPGTHRVTFRYQRPWYVYVGLFTSSATLLLLVGWGANYISGLLYQPPPSLKALPQAYREKYWDGDQRIDEHSYDGAENQGGDRL